VAETEAWFLWSNTEQVLGGPDTHETDHNKIPTGNTAVPVPTATIIGRRPNERIYYDLVGLDELVRAPEHVFTDTEISAVTPLVAPKITGGLSVSFVKSSSAVMYGMLNPENAKTEFFFEYGPGETLKECSLGIRHQSCPGVAVTPSAESAVYGKIATTLEASGLQPNTVYHYRLSAESENLTKTEKRTSFEKPSPEGEGEFTTAPAPVPQVETGTASAVGTTFATISGAVNPAGQAATYRFELGIYNGPSTRYGVVFSGSAGAGHEPIDETLALSGLRPGTVYAYRILSQNGSGEATGATVTFTTDGLPAVLVVTPVLAQLPVPKIAFPKGSAKITRAKELARALKACAKKRKKQRTSCERSARKKYAVGKKARKSSPRETGVSRGTT
jgi:hypothetical protein